jgi:hypothetical protein
MCSKKPEVDESLMPMWLGRNRLAMASAVLAMASAVLNDF